MSKNKNRIFVLSFVFLEVFVGGCISNQNQTGQQVEVAKRIEEMCKTKITENPESTKSG